MNKYPITFNIYTPDGSGEASKAAPGEPWTAMYCCEDCMRQKRAAAA